MAGERVVTRKKHACGSDVWTVTRTGADIKLTCARCGRTVMMGSDKAAAAISGRAKEEGR